MSYAIQRKTVQIYFCVCITQINSTYTPVSDLWKVSDIRIFSISVWVVCVTPPPPPSSHDASVRIVMRPSMHPYTLFITDKTVIQLDLSPCNLNLKGETVVSSPCYPSEHKFDSLHSTITNALWVNRMNIYSPSCHSKPVWLSFFSNIYKIYFLVAVKWKIFHQNIFCCVTKKKVSHTRLEQQEGE